MKDQSKDRAKDVQKGKQNTDKGMLERIANTIDPPSRDISDDELLDPGSNIPNSKPVNPRKKPPAGE